MAERRPPPRPRAIGLETACKMKAMYEERDERNGRRIWTIVQVAEHFGVSETSAYRAMNKQGAYREVAEPAPRLSKTELKEGEARIAELAGLMEAGLIEPEPLKPTMPRTEVKSLPANAQDRLAKVKGEKAVEVPVDKIKAELLRKAEAALHDTVMDPNDAGYEG